MHECRPGFRPKLLSLCKRRRTHKTKEESWKILRWKGKENKREEWGGGQLGVRVPPVKLNFAQRHRCTQIPGIRSASQRPMILWSINATLGVGTPQILIKNEPVNDFLPCFKVPNDMKKKRFVFMCGLLLLSRARRSWLLRMGAPSVFGSAAVRSHAADLGHKLPKDALLQSCTDIKLGVPPSREAPAAWRCS